MHKEAQGYRPGPHHLHSGMTSRPHATDSTLQPCGVANGDTFAGRGHSAADERRALPGVFGKVSGKCGGNIQGGYQKNVGFHP